jgi:putative PIN family toxin of toxin-antitoxin system
VLDTNVLISAIFWRRNEYTVLRKAFEGELELLTSRAILVELKGVLGKKFGAGRNWVEKVIKTLATNSITVDPKCKLNVIKDDESDNRILECAVDGAADYIISGDAHLLKLREFGGIPILKSKDFLKTLSRL